MNYVEWLKGRQCSFTVNNIRAFYIAAVSWWEKRNLDTTTAFMIWATTVLAGNKSANFGGKGRLLLLAGNERRGFRFTLAVIIYL